VRYDQIDGNKRIWRIGGPPTTRTGGEGRPLAIQGEASMYRVTMGLNPSERVSLRVANQDLARVLVLAARLRFLNPDFEVTYTSEEHARSGAA
jgi:hypothetical protein